MTYENALKYIHKGKRTSALPTLERMKLICSYLDNPQDNLRFVHVAGTNGKGSFTEMLSSVLTKAGYSVGRYISPYIIDFRERICTDGKMIPRADLVKCTEKVRAAVDKMKSDVAKVRNGGKAEKEIPADIISGKISEEPIEFELITAIAFLYFAEKNCDIVVLECGLGGEFDATNIICPPLLSVIMSVSYDHTELLGNTISEIARTKCGIIKRGTLEAVSYPQIYEDAAKEIKRACADRGVSLNIPDENALKITGLTLGALEFTYKGKEYKTSLCAEYQALNACTVIEAAKALERVGMEISDAAIKKGIADAEFPARFEILGISPDIVLDGAHNENGTAKLAESVSKVMPKGKLNLIIGMLKDKNPELAIKKFKDTLEKNCGGKVRYGNIIALTPDNPRALQSEELKKILSAIFGDCAQNISSFGACLPALDEMMKSMDKDDMLLCFGSLYMASEIRKVFPK